VTKKKKTTEADKGFLSRLGPGLITGASDDDPSGIGTYSQAGAQLGFGIGWTMLLTYPLMAAIQEISARIGRVTGGIAGNVCRNFPALVTDLARRNIGPCSAVEARQLFNPKASRPCNSTPNRRSRASTSPCRGAPTRCGPSPITAKRATTAVASSPGRRR
jgi:hypothetical protein